MTFHQLEPHQQQLLVKIVVVQYPVTPRMMVFLVTRAVVLEQLIIVYQPLI